MTNENEKNDLMELRAALLQLAKAMETERACVLRVVRLIERRLSPSNEPAVEFPPASTTYT